MRSSWGYCSVLINDVVGAMMIGFVLIVVEERILVGIWLVGVVHSPRRFYLKLSSIIQKSNRHTPPHYCNTHALVKK